MNAVDVNVKADPVSCRQLAAWLSRLVEANRRASAATSRAGSSAESFWQGDAGNAFAVQMGQRASDVDELADAVDRARSGLELFADDIDTVRQRMDQALRLAHESGLTVTGTVIHRPAGGASDTASDGAGGDMPGLDPKSQAHAETERKLKAYREIEATADEERRRERTAHRSLGKALDGSNTIVDAVASPTTWIARGFIAAGTAHSAATTLAQNAESQRNFAENFKRWFADSTLPAAVREERLNQLLTNAGMDQRAADSNARLLANTGKTSAGDLVLKRLTPTLGGQANTRLNSVGKAFSVASVVAASGFTAVDIMNGKPIGKSVWVNFGGLGAATAASTAAEAGMVSAGVVGAPVTATGLGVGFTAATAWTYFQENDLRDLYRDLGGDGIDNPNDKSDEYRKARYGR